MEDAYGTEIPPYFEHTVSPTWTADYPSEFRTLLPQRAGYTFHAGSADLSDPKGYFVNTDRRCYDFQSGRTGRGLVLEMVDPLHDKAANPLAHRTLVDYDEYQFLPIRVTDAAGLITKAVYDYRVLQPNEITDPNKNKSLFTYTPLGLLESRSLRGKVLSEGDQARPQCADGIRVSGL